MADTLCIVPLNKLPLIVGMLHGTIRRTEPRVGPINQSAIFINIKNYTLIGLGIMPNGVEIVVENRRLKALGEFVGSILLLMQGALQSVSLHIKLLACRKSKENADEAEKYVNISFHAAKILQFLDICKFFRTFAVSFSRKIIVDCLKIRI